MPNLLRLLVSLFALLTVLAHARNFTIDDTHPDIRYSPLTAWRGHGESPPDSELQRTWHHGINVSKRRCLVYDRSQRRSCVDTPVILSFKFIGMFYKPPRLILEAYLYLQDQQYIFSQVQTQYQRR